MVLAALGQKHIGRAVAAAFAQEQHGLVSHRLVEWCTHGFPVGEQLGERLRVKYRAREDVRARLGAFFQHHHRDVLGFFCGELFQADGGGQASRAAADHDHVVFH